METFEHLPQARRFHAPLQPDDTAHVTRGCRHTNPDICRKNSMPGVCAFVRSDGMCHSPPSTWERQYEKLKAQIA
jgi:hypothetical protein